MANEITGLMRRAARVATLSCVSLAAIASLAPQAQAIECRGRYQIISGNPLSTPYCEDNYLAQVARSYGSRVSARQIRNNPNKKAEVCRFMGFDNRVSDICAGFRDDGVRGFR